MDIKKAEIMVDSVVMKAGNSKMTGKPYKFWDIITPEGVHYSTNDINWTGKIGGPHAIQFTEKIVGRFTNRSLYEPRQYSSTSRPPVQKALQEKDTRIDEILEQTRINGDKLDMLLAQKKDNPF